jgi:hypothetical protein
MDGSQLLPLIGLVVGATLQFALSRVGESTKAKSALRVQAYVDYIACLTDSTYLRESERKAEVLSRAANAKTRISIYGTADVISALAEFEKTGAEIRTKEQQMAILTLISTMRAESVGKQHDVSNEDLGLMLLGVGRPVNPLTTHDQERNITDVRSG